MYGRTSPIHADPSPLEGRTVTLKPGVDDPAQRAVVAGAEYQVEDWWDRVGSSPWAEARGNPACVQYALRAAAQGLPLDDEVLYGKIGAFGHLVHISEIADGSGE